MYYKMQYFKFSWTIEKDKLQKRWGAAEGRALFSPTSYCARSAPRTRGSDSCC